MPPFTTQQVEKEGTAQHRGDRAHRDLLRTDDRAGGEVELVDWPELPEWPLRGTRIGIETVLRVAGRKDVKVEGRRTKTGASYLASWR